MQEALSYGAAWSALTTVAPRGFLPDDARHMRERARASRATANKRKKPLGIGRAARCRELPGLTRFRSPLNNALLPVMFRAAHIFATCGRASVRAGLATDQSELFCTDGGKRPAQSHKCRAPSRAPKPLGVRAFEGLGCAPTAEAFLL